MRPYDLYERKNETERVREVTNTEQRGTYLVRALPAGGGQPATLQIVPKGIVGAAIRRPRAGNARPYGF